MFIGFGGQFAPSRVEIAAPREGMLVRDSKAPKGPVLGFSRLAWRTFVDSVRQGWESPAP
ncbi:DUF397 domain-containing protein [Streptomyces varsoviensis]|uniref:DUF397 domain-containing protein n=1 Tax=Streptomyces varsoviensis TaxID=67373 RepID=UPI0033E82A7D